MNPSALGWIKVQSVYLAQMKYPVFVEAGDDDLHKNYHC
jgi:hypothetical protein